MDTVTRPSQPEPLGEVRASLGEGPVWDQSSGQLLWIDIVSHRLFRTVLATGRTDSLCLPHPVGVVVPRAIGGYMAALEDGFWSLDDEDGAERVAAVEADDPGTRFNDGACDPQGRFWAGTMAWDGSAGQGSLYRLDGDGTVTRILEGVGISNGLGWSPDGTTMYYSDSLTGRIDAFDFDARDGSISRRRPFVTLSREMGVPDGLCVDAEGGVWLATWGGWCVRRYLPDGSADVVLRLPVAQVSSCAFGGDDLGLLFVTTAREGLTSDERRAQPLAGRLFRAEPGIRGLTCSSYAG